MCTSVYICVLKIANIIIKHIIYTMAVPPSLLPSHSEKVLGAMKAERTVKRITFNPTEANPGETLYVSVPKLAENEVIVAGSLALVFNINLKVTGAHANNYLVQNVSRALVDQLSVKFAATIVQDTVWVRHLQDFRGPLYPTTRAGQHAARRASRVWICARFALALATRRPAVWMRKTA